MMKKLNKIGKAMVAFGLVCYGLKHLFHYEFIDSVIWIIIGLVGGMLMWISYVFAKDDPEDKEEVIKED